MIMHLPVSWTGWATKISPGSARGNLWIESDVAQTVNSKPHFKFVASEIDGSWIQRVVDHFYNEKSVKKVRKE